MVHVPTSWNNLKTKIDGCELKTVKLEKNKWCSNKWSCEKRKIYQTGNKGK